MGFDFIYGDFGWNFSNIRFSYRGVDFYVSCLDTMFVIIERLEQDTVISRAFG